MNCQMENLEQLIFGEAEALKMYFQAQLKQIVVTPVEDANGGYFTITGDVDLFSDPKGVVQTNQVYSFGLHYKLPVACTVRLRTCRAKQTLPMAA